MAKFSIKNALVYGFSTYAQHFMLLVAAGLTFGAVHWGMTGIPKLVADQLGVKVHASAGSGLKKMGPKAAMAHNVAGHPVMKMGAPDSKIGRTQDHLTQAGKAIHHVLAHKAYQYMDNDPGKLLVVFLVWLAMYCLWVFMCMGLIRIALDLIDKNTSSYERLFSQRSLFFPFLGVWIVYFFLMVVIILGAILAGAVIGGLLAIPLVLIFGDAGGVVAGLVGGVAGMAVYIKFIMRYLFCTFCLIDKKMGVHKAFSCTYEITKGSVLRLLGLGIILLIVPGLLAGGSIHLHMRIGKMVASDSYHVGIIATLVMNLVMVWITLCLSHVYRKLSKA